MRSVSCSSPRRWVKYWPLNKYNMETFRSESSIVKKIWGSTDITLFIFAGAAAEFALNKQADWLYFTGKLPADPIGRLFSTVHYAQEIIFTEERSALSTIDRINSIHHAVESARGIQIPETAYKDVLYMLIHYSIAAFELLERKLNMDEKDEVVLTFRMIGERMKLRNIPASYGVWSRDYAKHLQQNLENGFYTKDLFKRYRKHLGAFRYFLVLEIQRMLVPGHVNELLHLGKPRIAHRVLPAYRLIRRTVIGKVLLQMMVPQRFQSQLAAMNKRNLRTTGERVSIFKKTPGCAGHNRPELLT